jgi:GLPGLI family protein
LNQKPKKDNDMKKLILISIILASLSGYLMAQGGTIIFEEVRKLEFKTEGEMASMMVNMPKEQRKTMELIFSDNATLYRRGAGDGGAAGNSWTSAAGEKVHISVSTPDNSVYVDLEAMKMTEQRDFMTRMFLIEQELDNTGWKITGEQREILGYNCIEATRADTSGAVTTAWFAPTFPGKGGPATWCTLPGMVLEVTTADGKQHITALSADLTPPEPGLLKKPKNGKKVSRPEFDALVAEKMKEMGETLGSGEMIMIRVTK